MYHTALPLLALTIPPPSQPLPTPHLFHLTPPPPHTHILYLVTHQLGPRYEGQLMSDGGAYSPFRSILLVLTHDFIITCVYGPTGSDGHERKDADAAFCTIFVPYGSAVCLGPGILAYLCTRQHWLWIKVELHIFDARHEEAVAREGGRYAPVRRILGSEPLSLRTHR